MKKVISLLTLSVVLLLTSFTPRPLTWVAIGDSITYLNDHPDETGHRVTKGYLSCVTDKLPNVHFINQGHNGWSAVQIAKGIEKLGIRQGDVYSIFLGTNDWWQSKPIGRWEDYLNASTDTTIYGAFRVIVDKIRSLNKDASIILITPMQRGDFVYINKYSNKAHGSYLPHAGQTLEQVADAILAIGKYEHLKIVDLFHDRKLSIPRMVNFKRLKDPQTGTYRNYSYPEYTTVPFDPAKDEYPYPPDAANYTFDGLHPSDKGNAYIAKRLVKILKKM
jgi:lysophospholipase L1-like esterase